MEEKTTITVRIPKDIKRRFMITLANKELKARKVMPNIMERWIKENSK